MTTISCFCYSLPVLESSGKLNKKALASMSVTGDVSSVNPRDSDFTPMERQLAAIWCRVLKLKSIDVQENFFDLGGYISVMLTVLQHTSHSSAYT